MIADVRYCMSAKIFQRCVCWICGVITALFTIVSLGVSGAETAPVKTVYYVVERTESLQASSCQMALRGGAGYIMSEGVAFGVYFSAADAEGAVAALCEEYDTIVLYPKEIRLSARADEAAYSILQVVDGWIRFLQGGGAQAVVREGLRTSAKLLSWCAEEGDEAYLSELAVELENRLAEKVLYTETLREFTCFACERLSLRNRRRYYPIERI